MKTKLKSMSKRTLSVLLVLLMVVSTVTVGIITTTAAFIESDDNVVGASVDADNIVGTTGNEKLYIGQGDTSLTYQGTINTTPQEYTLKQGNNWINICWDNSNAWNNSYVWYNDGDQKPRWNISGANGVGSIDIVNNSGCYYIRINVNSEAKYNFSVTGTSAEDLTLVLTGGIDPVCSSLSLTASKNALSSETDTFTLTATATSLAETPVTYKIYRTGTSDPIAMFSNTSNTSVTTEALTQSDAKSATYYATVEKSGYETKQSSNVTVTNNAVVEPLFYINGSIGGGSWGTHRIIDTHVSGNVFCYELNITTTDNNAVGNRFRLWKNGGTNDYGPDRTDSSSDNNAEATEIVVNASEQTSTRAGISHNYFQVNVATAGKYRLYVDQTNENAPKLWISTQKKVASSVALTVTPSEVKLGNKIRTITATVTGVDSSLDATKNITYTFKTGSTVLGTVTKKANETTCTISDIASGDGTPFIAMQAYDITVEVSTAETYIDGSDAKKYLPVTATSSVTFNNGAIYYTNNNNLDSPQWSKLTENGLTTIENNVKTLSAGETFTFALSSEQGYVEAFPLFNISQADNKYCSVTQGTKHITVRDEQGNDVGFSVYTYTVTPLTGIKANTAKLYIDTSVDATTGKPVNKIYAKAEFVKTTGSSGTFSESKTIKYYFAKMKSQNKTGTIDGRTDGSMWLRYWNNNIERTVQSGNGQNYGYVQAFPIKKDGTIPTKKEGGSTVNISTSADNQGTQIYLDASALVYDSNGPQTNSGFNQTNDDIFDVYVAEIPIWATSVCLQTNASADLDYDASSTDIPPSTLITINPNRIYCFFKPSGDSKVRVSGVPLDAGFWENNVSSRGTYPNEAGEKTFKANAVKFNRQTYGTDIGNKYNVNKVLSERYNGTTTTGLYFGNFWNCDYHNTGNDQNSGKYDTTWKNWNATANIAMRWANKLDSNNDKNEADWFKKQGKCPYFASIWDLVGMHLNTNKKNAMGNYVLQNFDESANMPVFDYEWLKDNLSNGTTKATTNIFENKDFPFVSSTYEGITTYSYDSQVDANRAITKNNNGNTTKENFVNTHQYKKLGSMLGYEPFVNYDDTDGGKYSFANEFDIEFYLTNTGSLKGKRGNETISEDIQFNFSGDDDVWVFVDGVLVLDLGGDHMPSAGSINFTKQKVYYKSAAKSVKELSENFIGSKDQDDFTTDMGSVYTLDLAMLLNSGSLTGEKFNFKDGSTKHVLQMFYLERGDNESNCSLSFNMPQATGLNVYNEVTANQVNPGLKAAAMLSANTDAFRYNMSVKQAESTEWNKIQTKYGLINDRKTPTSATQLETEPKFPTIFDAWRVFTQDGTEMKGRLNPTSGTSSEATLIQSLTTSFQPLAGYTYELSDNYVSTTVHDPIAGHTYASASGNFAAGDFDLLMGQKATFNNQIQGNTMIRLYQNKDLDEANYGDENDLITVTDRAMNEVYDYYTTTYDIYDNQLQYYVRTADHDATSTNHIYAADESGNENSFYFTNYSTDSKVVNPAMTVSYHNDINVGNIKVQKQLGTDPNATTENVFSFKVYFKNVFGFDETDSKYSSYTAYNEYPITYHRYNTETNKPVFASVDDPDPAIPYDEVKGIVLRAGEYAIIEGVPVETEFQVEEAAAAGYNLSEIRKWAKYPGYQNDRSNGDVTYRSRNDKDGLYVGEQIYYQRITNATKQMLVPPDTNNNNAIQLDNEYMSTYDYSHQIPNGNGDDTDDYPVNSIPIRSQTNVSKQGGDEYISTSWVLFNNQRDGVQITFNYYPRYVKTGQPASISSTPDTYTYTIEDLYEKDDQGNYKYIVMENDQVNQVLFNKMIDAAMVKFVTLNGGVFKNVIDDYEFFNSQKQAEAKFKVNGGSITNPGIAGKGKDITAYTAENIKYHTNHYSQPITTTNKSDMWVSYFKSNKEINNNNYVDIEGLEGEADKENMANVKKVNIWLYNTPHEYKVEYRTADTSENATSFNTSSNNTYNGYYVATKQSDKDPFKFYYNQRFGGRAYNQDGTPAEEELYFLGPNEYGFDSYTNQEVETAEEVDMGGTKLKFLYWAFDPYGYNKASDDIRYYYRVSTDFTLYPVYGTEEQYNTFKGKPGLSVSLNGEDSYFDANGSARRRLNVLMSPYNCPNDDKNIYSTSVFFITLSDEVIELCKDGGRIDEKKVNELYQKYRDQLAALIKEDNSVGGNFTFDHSGTTYTLTAKGFKHDINQGDYSKATLTNKNRGQFATRFTMNEETVQSTMLVTAAMLYYNDKLETPAASWLTSDNAVVYDFSALLNKN